MVAVDQVLIQLLNGLSDGSAIVLVALGLSLVFGVMDIVNFAHGEFYMMGAYGILLVAPFVPSYWIAVILAGLVVALVGIAMEQTTIRPLRGRDPLQTLIVTFGLVLVFQQAAFEIFGGEVESIQAPITGSISFLGVTYPVFRIVTIVATVALLILTYLFLERTRLGVYIQASSQNLEIARSLGVPANRVFTITFAISALLAAIAAGFLAPVRGIEPGMGAGVILDAFIVVILGGLGSIFGTVLAGYLIGLTQALSIIWIPPFASEALSFAILIVVLLFRPQGLFGTEGDH